MDPTPRLGLSDFPVTLATQLHPRVARLGYLGEFFQVAGHQPDALGHFVGFTEALKSALDPRLVEVVALTVATVTGNAYERVQHERLALTVGMTVEEVVAIGSRDLSGPSFSEAERAAAQLALDVTWARGRSCEPAYAALLALTGPADAVGCLMTATRYLAHATMANTWGLRPPVSSPIAQAVDGRD